MHLTCLWIIAVSFTHCRFILKWIFYLDAKALCWITRPLKQASLIKNVGWTSQTKRFKQGTKYSILWEQVESYGLSSETSVWFTPRDNSTYSPWSLHIGTLNTQGISAWSCITFPAEIFNKLRLSDTHLAHRQQAPLCPDSPGHLTDCGVLLGFSA